MESRLPRRFASYRSAILMRVLIYAQLLAMVYQSLIGYFQAHHFSEARRFLDVHCMDTDYFTTRSELGAFVFPLAIFCAALLLRLPAKHTVLYCSVSLLFLAVHMGWNALSFRN